MIQGDNPKHSEQNDFKMDPEVCSEPCQRSEIIDAINYFRKKLRLRYLTRC